MRQALILVGHGAGEEASVLYQQLTEEIQKAHPDTWLVMLHGKPDAGQAAEELAAAGITEALILPLLLAPGHHLSKNIAAEDSEIRRAFARAGIHTKVKNNGLLEDETIRRTLADHCIRNISG